MQCSGIGPDMTGTERPAATDGPGAAPPESPRSDVQGPRDGAAELLAECSRLVDVITTQFPEALAPCYSAEELTALGHRLAGAVHGEGFDEA